MLSGKGQLVLALGGVVYLVAWLFGSEPLYPVGIGLVAAVGLSVVWVRLLAKPKDLRRFFATDTRLDGDDVPVRVALELSRGLRPSFVDGRELVDGLGEFPLSFERTKGGYTATYTLERVPRGRYGIESTRVVAGDPFGFAVQQSTVHRGGSLLVFPRVVELGALFSETGSRVADGRRLLLRRQTGFDFHSVREYEQGESLRRVHWPTTARRGKLMVKELEDAPRDEALVILDAQEGTVTGSGRHSSFEVAVQAAGSIARAHATRGQRAGMLINDRTRGYQAIHSLEADWPRALELLAVSQPTGHHALVGLLEDGAGPAANAPDLSVVTSSLTTRLADRLARRTAGRRGTAVVLVEPNSFLPDAPPESQHSLDTQAALLRLAQAGIPVAIVRKGDVLQDKLGSDEDGESFTPSQRESGRVHA